jgi:formylglycine-generating enzyme required for sulfatase activity
MTTRLTGFSVVLFAVWPSINPCLANAPAGRYAVANGTVYDSQTRLTWQQGIPATMFTMANAAAYCGGLSATLAGTWRVPTVKELQTIVDYSKVTGPMIDSNAFSGTPSARFWSMSGVADNSSYEWYVSFADGTTSSDANSKSYYVRCVR